MDHPVARSAVEIVRNLAVQVPFNLGPFNALSIPGKSLESIVYLAVGLHGWWRTPEATNSLLSIIKMQHSDDEVLSAPSFELSIFQAIEANHPFHGAVISDEEAGTRGLRGVELQGPITRGEDGPKAILCMRALTTGLLCLFDRSDVFDILFTIMQKCLIHFHQPGVQFDQYGPFSSALKDWVHAETTKEAFRQKSPRLMKKLDAAARTVSNVTVKDLQNTQFFETELVIAFLQWLFAEEYKHDLAIKRDYPTRSFHVWSLASLLSQLGFLVEASTTPIQDPELWKDQVSDTSDTNRLWRVHLVTSSSVFADLSYSHRPSRRMDLRKKRLVPIGSIPTVAFDYFRYYDTPDLDLNLMNEIFIYAFSDVTDQLPNYPYLQALAGLRGEGNTQQLPQKHVAVQSQMTDYQRQKLEDWVDRPEFAPLLQKSIINYIPEQFPDHCGKARCYYPVIPFEDTDDFSEEANSWRKELRRDHVLMSPWIKMHVIMLAFAYAVACPFVMADDGKRADLDTEVSWTPMQFFEDLDDWERVRLAIPDGDLKTWVRTMSDVLNFRLEPLDRIPTEKWPQYKRLKKTLFHMMCGHRCEVRNGREDPGLIQEDTLGCSANGLTLLSKILVNPTVDASNLHLFYIRFGRILELPVNSNHLIEGCTPRKRPKHVSKFDPSTQPQVWGTVMQNGDNDFSSVRWDAEPDWSIDSTKVGFCCRLNGLPCGIFSPWYLARRSCLSEEDPERCPCICSPAPPEQEITFPDDEHWTEYHLCDFYRTGSVFDPHPRSSDHIALGETRNIFVRAGEQAHNQLAALDMFIQRASNKPIFDTVVRKILSSCLVCAAEPARKQPSHWTRLFRGQMNTKRFINFIVLAS